MFERTFVTAESCTHPQMKAIKAASFYSRRTSILLPECPEKRRKLIGKPDEILLDPMCEKIAREKGMIESGDELESYLDSLTEEAEEKAMDLIEEAIPKAILETSHRLFIWRIATMMHEEELATLSSEGLIHFAMSSESRLSWEDIQDFGGLDKNAILSSLADAKNRRVFEYWMSRLPLGLPTLFHGLLLSVTQKESAKQLARSLAKKDRKKIRKLQSQSGYLIPNVIYAILVSATCHELDAVPVSTCKEELELLDAVANSFGLETASKTDRLAVSTSDFLLKRSLPNISYLPAQELIKIRERCLPELEALWAAVKRLSWSSDLKSDEVHKNVLQLTETSIDPAIHELKASMRSATRSTLRGFTSVRSDFLTAGAVFYVGSWLGQSTRQHLINAIAVAAGAFMPGVVDAITKNPAKAAQDQSPFGVLLKLEKVNTKLQMQKKRDEKRRKKRKEGTRSGVRTIHALRKPAMRVR